MKITFLLLLAGGEDIYLATSILFPSIIDNFDTSSIEKILIVVKDDDSILLKMRLDELKEKVNHNLKISVVSESNLIDNKKIKNTYYLQMLLKLLSCKMIKTEYYLTLDADIIFFNKSNFNDFVSKDESGSLKAHFYKSKKIDVWTERSVKYLEYKNKLEFTINQTPFVFKTNLVNKMIKNINLYDLILNKQCSEYTLYFIYLLKNNLFFDNYKFSRFSEFSISYPVTLLSGEKLSKFLRIIKNKKKAILIIQSRVNMHLKLKSFINEVTPSNYYNKPKIGLLTCVSGKKYLKRYKKAIELKQKYCIYHNYTFIYEYNDTKKYPKDKGWIKIYKLKEKLEDYDFIMVSDADSIITNRDVRIEDIIFKYMKENHNMLITSDYNSINSGNMIWKNNNVSKTLISEFLRIGDDKVRYTINKPYRTKGIYEQPTLIYLINKFIDIRNKIKIIPQFEMNSYGKFTHFVNDKNIIKKINDIPNRCFWKEGDFLIHFAGYNYMKDGDFEHDIDNIIKKYVNIYDTKLKEKEGSDFGKIR